MSASMFYQHVMFGKQIKTLPICRNNLYPVDNFYAMFFLATCSYISDPY